MENWRLLITPAVSGAENMAVDEAILRASEKEMAPPTLRLYGWSEPTISIGYMQDPGTFASSGLPVVRRITGGRAVLHHIELTYSVVAPMEMDGFSGGIIDTYSLISRCIVQALKDIGIDADIKKGASGDREASRKDACFHAPSRYEILLNGRKLVGSSQRRFKKSFLQHGSIIFGVDGPLNTRVFGAPVVKKIATIEEISDISIPAFSDVLAGRFASGLGAEFERSGLAAIEEEFKARFLKERYSRREWNLFGGRTDAPGAAAG